jgi:hypothetical protein
MRIYSTDDSNPDYDIVNKIYQNTGRATNSGIELLFSQDLTEHWQVSASINWYENAIDAYQGILLFPFERPFAIGESSEATGDAKVSTEISFPGNLALQLTGLYYAKRNIPQGEELSRASFDAGLKKQFWEKRAEITLSATDILNTFGIRQRIQNDGFTATYENYYETQVVRLAFKYKL